jgi:hypothetical protein
MGIPFQVFELAGDLRKSHGVGPPPAESRSRGLAISQHDTIAKATINMSGVISLAGQTLNITNGAKITVNPGSILADFILPG